MGLLKHVLFWPVTGPKFLVDFSLRRVHGVVREELTDDARIKEDLLELQLRLEIGEVDEAEYARHEAELMRQLRDVQRWREEFGMATRGPVRVAGTEGQEEPEKQEPDISSSGNAAVELHLEFEHDEERG